MSALKTAAYLAGLFILAVLLHLMLGWAWTIAAGLGAGIVFDRKGWLLGAAVVGADWLAILLYNYLVDARAVVAMTEAMGSILGNMPSFVVVAITVLIGLLIGLLGGATGSQLRRIVRRRPTVNA